MSCGQHHPSSPQVICENPSENHKLCTGYSSVDDEFLDWENPEYKVPQTRSRKGAQQHLEDVATRVASDYRVASSPPLNPDSEGIAMGFSESERTANRWSEDQKQLVLNAIIAVAKENEEFTTDLVWQYLNGAVPVTKGMTAMLRSASRKGILDSTGKTEVSSRGGEHDHGQRLTIWYSLIKGQK
jgi:hypothetical protein